MLLFDPHHHCKVHPWFLICFPDLFNYKYDYRPNWTTESSVPINHNFRYNKICDILRFLKLHTRCSESLLVGVKIKNIQVHGHDRLYCSIISLKHDTC